MATTARDSIPTPTSEPLRRLGRWYRDHEKVLLGTFGVLLILVPWELSARLGLVNDVLVSSPSAVAESFGREVQRGTLWPNLSATATVWIVGFGLAVVVGLLIGFVAGWYRPAKFVANAWLNTWYAAPSLVFIPMFIMWFGIGFTFKVWVVFVGAIYYVAINVIAGVQATEDRFLSVAKTYGASQFTILRAIVIPGSTPYIITGLRLAASRSIVGVVVAEFISSNQGIGFMIINSAQFLNTPKVMVGIVMLGAFGILIGEVFGFFERRLEVWRRTTAT